MWLARVPIPEIECRLGRKMPAAYYQGGVKFNITP